VVVVVVVVLSHEGHSKSFEITPLSIVWKFLLVFHCNYDYLPPFLRYSTSNNGVP